MCTLNHARTLITYFKTLFSIYHIAYHICTRIVKYQAQIAVITAILMMNMGTLHYQNRTLYIDDIG